MKFVLYSPNPLELASPRQLNVIDSLLKIGEILIVETNFSTKPTMKINKRKLTDIDVISVPLWVVKELGRVNYLEIILYIIFSLIHILLLVFCLLVAVFKTKSNIIIASNQHDLGGIACAFINLITFNKINYIYEFRELTPELYTIRMNKKNLLVYKFLYLMEKISAKRAKSIVVVSEQMKKIITKRHNLNVEKVHVIYPFPSIPKNLEFRNSDIPRIFIYGGNYLKKIHDMETLIFAVEKIKELLRAQSVKIFILGDGEKNFRKELKDLVKKLNLEDIIEFFAKLPKKDYYHLLTRAYAGLIPLKNNELTALASPNKLFDYLLFNKIVIAPSLPSILEIKDKYGYPKLILYEPENKESLSRAILNSLCIKTERITKINKEFSWQKNEDRFLNLIKSLIKQN